MRTNSTGQRRRRRLPVAAVSAVMALGTFPAGALAQGAAPAAPVSIDAFCAAVPDGYDPFDDVSSDHTFAAAIACLNYTGITLGVRPGVYDPGATVDREHMAAFVHRLLLEASLISRYPEAPGSPLAERPHHQGPDFFTDVPDTGFTATFSQINDLASVGIVQGGPGDLPATTYGLHLPVTREQMASYIARSLEYLTGSPLEGGVDRFPDDERSTHEANINALAEAGIVVGDDAGRFRPADRLNRGQMAAFLVRTLAHLHAADRLPPYPVMVPGAADVGARDNGDGTATIEVWLRNVDNAGLLGVDDVELTLALPGETSPSNLATLIEERPGTWGPFRANGSSYSVVFRAAPGSYTFTDITVRGEVVAPSVTVTVSGR